MDAGKKGMCFSSFLQQQQDPDPSWVESEVLKAGAMPEGRGHILMQDKRTFIQYDTGQDISTRASGKVRSPAQAVCAPYLSVRKFSRPKTHSSVVEQGSKNCMCETAFPTNKKQRKH